MQYFYYHDFNPIFFKIGPIVLYWYGVMYAIGFVFSIFFLSHRKLCFKNSYSNQEIQYLVCLSMFGVILGGRIGYVVFYKWSFFSQNFLQIFNIQQGGMSFHGGLIGVILAIMWFSYRKNQSFFQVADFLVPAVPCGLGLGRLGNFVNGELWGKVATDIPWAMLFPGSRYEDILILRSYPQWSSLFEYYGLLPRHPSQLYEMFLEGIALFIIIYIFTKKRRPIGSVSGLFLLCYGFFRVIVETFRQPDSSLGLVGNMVSVGQILSFPMIILGSIIIYISYKNQNSCSI